MTAAAKARKVRKVKSDLTFGAPPAPGDTGPDLMTCALIALAHARQPPDEARNTIVAAITIIGMPANTAAAARRRMLLLQTVMGFGPLGRPEGCA